MTRYLRRFETPLGPMYAVVDDAETLYALGFGAPAASLRRRFEPVTEDPRRGAAVVRQVREFLEGRRRHFDLRLSLEGTPFQRRAWQALRRVGYGETVSYGELARRMGRPGASRAVGGAMGANPVPLVVPCHRVVGASGALTGFGAGLEVKRRLLALEDEVAAEV